MSVMPFCHWGSIDHSYIWRIQVKEGEVGWKQGITIKLKVHVPVTLASGILAALPKHWDQN